jgi:drug/metabolite transporter (DMT)-like permease
MQQHDPSVTPWTGNPVVTGYIVSGIVAGIVFVAKKYGHEVDPNNQNILVELLAGPVGEVVAFLTAVVMALYTRMRAYTELSLKVQTGMERPPVEPLTVLAARTTP